MDRESFLKALEDVDISYWALKPYRDHESEEFYMLYINNEVYEKRIYMTTGDILEMNEESLGEILTRIRLDLLFS